MIRKIITNNFKVFIIALFVFFSVNTNSFGQNVQNEANTSGDIYKNAITFGITHSLQFTTITGTFPNNKIQNLESNISASTPRTTFSFGMTMDYHFSKKLSLQFDFLYTYIGAHLVQKTIVYNELGIIENNKYYTYATSYFKFPLTLNFYPLPLLYINGGGYFAPLVLSSEYEHWYNSREPIEDIKPIDYGFVAGFGFNFKYVKLGFQYSYGIGNFINNKSSNLHHNVFELSVRWKFYSDIRNRS